MRERDRPVFSQLERLADYSDGSGFWKNRARSRRRQGSYFARAPVDRLLTADGRQPVGESDDAGPA